jgi:hypothetical protein
VANIEETRYLEMEYAGRKQYTYAGFAVEACLEEGEDGNRES